MRPRRNWPLAGVALCSAWAVGALVVHPASARPDDHDSLSTIAPTPFALVSFAHADGNEATDALVDRINDSGRFYITASEADGLRYARLSVGSTWTTRAHIDALWELIDQPA